MPPQNKCAQNTHPHRKKETDMSKTSTMETRDIAGEGKSLPAGSLTKNQSLREIINSLDIGIIGSPIFMVSFGHDDGYPEGCDGVEYFRDKGLADFRADTLKDEGFIEIEVFELKWEFKKHV